MTQLDVEVVDIRKMMGGTNLKAMADVKLADSLIIKGFSVIKGKNGVFVSMPRKAGRDGKWYDTLTPLNDAIKHELQDKVLEAYDRETDGAKD